MNQIKSLHIVCHEIPYPVDYGGMTDLYFKIRSLHAEGIKIKLHCFKHNREEQPELNRYCESVHYYPRRSKLASLSFRLPYIVSCRRSGELLRNLMKDKDPVLLEGIHCTYYLSRNCFSNRKVIVRLHNAEYIYYKHLFLTEKNFFKKSYFNLERRLLKNHEKEIAPKASYVTVSTSDLKLYQQEFQPGNIVYLPAFLPFHDVTVLKGRGTYCLYHGNLSVPENEQAVLWLLHKVFEKNDIPFVIAGKNPSRLLKKKAEENKNICLIENPVERDMMDLLQKAHIHVLPSLNKTGVKLKLLYALFCGRFVITNQDAVDGSALGSLCTICNSPSEFSKEIKFLMQKDMTDTIIESRKKILQEEYNNEANTKKLMQLIW